MNKIIKKTIAYIGYWTLKPISYIARNRTSSLSVTNAYKLVHSVYNIKRHGLNYVGGGKFSPRLRPCSIDVSFIIPVYNSELFLERCIRSILQQETSIQYEVICINDGSTDGSLSILKRLQQKFPKMLTVESQQNKGISATRNRGIELARGEYISFIDNDDFVSEGYIEYLWQCRKQTDADMIQTGYRIVNIEGNTIDTFTHTNYITENQYEISNLASGYVWSGLHRKSQFENIRFPIGFWYEDMITKLILARTCKKFAFLNKCLYNKTEHKKNASKVLWNEKEYKCIDQYFLTFKLAEYGKKELRLTTDAALYGQLIQEMCLLWERTKHIGKKYREALFVLCAQQMREYAKQLPAPYSHLANYRSEFEKNMDIDLNKNTYWKWEIDGWIGKFEKRLSMNPFF